MTDPRHRVRAKAALEKSGFRVSPAPADNIATIAKRPDARLQRMRRIVLELFGQLYYRVAGHV